MAADSKVTLAGQALRVAPGDIRWNFKMKTTDSKSVGGKVIQILGVKLSDITIKGQYTPDRKAGDRESWEQQLRFREQVKTWARAAEAVDDPKPLRFTYPPRGWDFNVFVVKVSAIKFSVDENPAPEWELVLFPVGGGTRTIVKDVKDLYIQRLMDGIGWKQSAYNGPTQQEVDTTLDGRTPEEYLGDGYQNAFEGDSGFGPVGS